jgi:hypothetical protein
LELETRTKGSSTGLGSQWRADREVVVRQSGGRSRRMVIARVETHGGTTGCGGVQRVTARRAKREGEREGSRERDDRKRGTRRNRRNDRSLGGGLSTPRYALSLGRRWLHPHIFHSSFVLIMVQVYSPTRCGLFPGVGAGPSSHEFSRFNPFQCRHFYVQGLL